jgi:hypothetical protein
MHEVSYMLTAPSLALMSPPGMAAEPNYRLTACCNSSNEVIHAMRLMKSASD